MKQKHKIMIVSLLVGFILVFLNYKKFGINEVVNSFKNFNISVLPYYLLVVLLIEILGTYRWSIILKAFKHKISLISLFFYRMAGFSVGYLSPQAHIGGEPVRALLLKREGIDFKKAISTIVIDKFMLLVTDIIFIFIAGVIMFLHFSLSRDIKILFVSILVLLSIFVGSYFYCMIKRKPFFSALFNIKFWKDNKKVKKIRKDIEDIEHTIQIFYKNHSKFFLYVVLVQIVMYGLMFLEYYFAISLFNFTPNPFVVFMLMGAVAFSYSMPVPMALGVLETSQTSALGLLNINKTIGLSISLIIRAKDLTKTLIGGLALFYYGVIEKLFKKAKSKDEKQAVQFI